MLKISSGRIKGRRLQTLKGQQTRPTLDKTKGVLFNSLCARYDLSGFTVYDLFAGSGALGLEAYSRGANKAVFIEIHKPAYSILKANIGQFPQAPLKAHCRDVQDWLKSPRLEQPSLFLLDPPYSTTLAQSVINQLSGLSLAGSLLVLERDQETLIRWPQEWELFLSKSVGRSQLDFLELT